jgi:hypothetical protein
MNRSKRFLMAGSILAVLGLSLWLFTASRLVAGLVGCIGVALLLGWASAELRRNLTVPPGPDKHRR